MATSKRVCSVLALLLISAVLVVAVHTITPSTINLKEDFSNVYNITINNSDTTATANITEINITIPLSFEFVLSTNGTSLGGAHTFVNTSTVLSWLNASGLLMNLTTAQFWFNATVSEPGSYVINITTLNASGAVASSNIAISINSTKPLISFANQTSGSDGANLSQAYIIYNVSASDDIGIDTILLRLYNASNATAILNTTLNSSAASLFGNFSLPEGKYTLNATVNDTLGNTNTTTRSYLLDTTAPVVTLISPVNGTSSTTSAYNFTFNVTDTNPVANCSLVHDGVSINTLAKFMNDSTLILGVYNTSFPVGKRTWNINCSDYSGNRASSTFWVFYVTEEAAATTDTSSSGSVGNYPTYKPTNANLMDESGYSVSLGAGWKVQFSAHQEAHSLKIDSFSNGAQTATITVASTTPRQETLKVGEEWKVELNSDNVYDLLVTLVSVTGSKAEVNMKLISEKFEPVEETVSAEEQLGASPDLSPDSSQQASERVNWGILSIVAVLLVLAVVLFFVVRAKKKGFK